MAARPMVAWASLARAILVGAACLISVLNPGVASAQGYEGFGDDVRAIARKLQCPVCEGTSVADSPSQVARDMRVTIRRKLDAGDSEAAILDFFVTRYGVRVLSEPPRSGFYSAVWWVPGLGLLLGLGAIYSVVKRRRGDLPGDGGVQPSPPTEDLEDYRQRLRDLEEGGR